MPTIPEVMPADQLLLLSGLMCVQVFWQALRADLPDEMLGQRINSSNAPTESSC